VSKREPRLPTRGSGFEERRDNDGMRKRNAKQRAADLERQDRNAERDVKQDGS